MPPALTVLIPAAGLSSRMRGRDKLVEQIDGVPLLRRQVRIALHLNAKVFVTLPPEDTSRAESLADLAKTNLTIQRLANASEGMSASLRAGAAFCQRTDHDGLMIFLPDLPDLTRDDLTLMARIFAQDPTQPVRATDCTGRAGHPVILPRHVLPGLAALRGDDGARDILRASPPRLCPLPDHHATLDLDTPEAWAAWRAHRSN